MHQAVATRKRGQYDATLSTYHVGQQLLYRLWRRPSWQTMTSLSQAHLGRLCGVSDRTVRTALKWWESNGAIMRRVAQPIATGGRRPDLLFVHRKRLLSVLKTIRATWVRSARAVSVSVYSFLGEKINRLQTGVCRGVSSMQGKLFQRSPKPKAAKAIDPNSTQGRLQTWRRLYQARHGKACVITSIPQTLGTIGRLREALPSAVEWHAACEAYLRQADRAVVEAAHPLHWLPRRLSAMLPAVRTELTRLEAIERDRLNACQSYARDIERLGVAVADDIRDNLGALQAAYKAATEAQAARGPSEREIAAQVARDERREALRAQWEAIRGARCPE